MPSTSYEDTMRRINILRDSITSQYERGKQIIVQNQQVRTNISDTSRFNGEIEDTNFLNALRDVERSFNLKIKRVDDVEKRILPFMRRNDMSRPISQQIMDTITFMSNMPVNKFKRRATERDDQLQKIYENILNLLVTNDQNQQQKLMDKVSNVDSLTIPSLIYQRPSTYISSEESVNLIQEVQARLSGQREGRVVTWDTETFGGGRIWQYGFYDASTGQTTSNVIAPSREYLEHLRTDSFAKGLNLTQQEAITWNTIARMGHEDTIFDLENESVRIAGRDISLSQSDFNRGLERFIQLSERQRNNLVTYGEGQTITQAGKQFVDTMANMIFGDDTIAIGHNTFMFDNAMVQSAISSSKELSDYAKFIGFTVPEVTNGRQFDTLNAIRSLNNAGDRVLFETLFDNEESAKKAQQLVRQGYGSYSLDMLSRIVLGDTDAVQTAHDAGTDAENLFKVFTTDFDSSSKKTLLDTLEMALNHTPESEATNIIFSPENGTELFSLRSSVGAAGSGTIMFTTDDLTNNITFDNGLVLNKDTGAIVSRTNNTGSATIGRNRTFRAVRMVEFNPSDISSNPELQKVLENMLTFQNGVMSKSSSSLYMAELRSELPTEYAGQRAANTSTYIVGTKDDISRAIGTTMVPLTEDSVKGALGSVLSSSENKELVKAEFGVKTDDELERLIQERPQEVIEKLRTSGATRVLYDRARRSSESGSFHSNMITAKVNDIANDVQEEIEKVGTTVPKTDILRYMIKLGIAHS